MRSEGGIDRLVCWLTQRVRSLRAKAFIGESGLTVRTLETVEIEETTLLLGQAQVTALDACPLCGSRPVLSPVELARPPHRR